jgi:hypothetical protein
MHAGLALPPAGLSRAACSCRCRSDPAARPDDGWRTRCVETRPVPPRISNMVESRCPRAVPDCRILSCRLSKRPFGRGEQTGWTGVCSRIDVLDQLVYCESPSLQHGGPAEAVRGGGALVQAFQVQPCPSSRSLTHVDPSRLAGRMTAMPPSGSGQQRLPPSTSG